MKRTILMLLVFALIFPATFVAAQGDDLTQSFTSEDGRLTFNYPDGWFVNVDEEGDISVSTVEGSSSEIGDVVPSGQVSISIGVGSPEDFADDGFVLPVNASAEFMAGFWTGLYSIVIVFASAFSEEPAPTMTIGEVEMIEINGETAALVQIDLEDAQSALFITMSSSETSIRTLIVSTAYGEMDNYRDIGVAMMESVEFTP